MSFFFKYCEIAESNATHLKQFPIWVRIKLTNSEKHPGPLRIFIFPKMAGPDFQIVTFLELLILS